MFPHEKRQTAFHKGNQESDEIENMGERPLSDETRRTVSLFDLRPTCTEDHLPKYHSRSSTESLRLRPSSPHAGPSIEPLRLRHSSPHAGASAENLCPGPSSSHAGPSSESLRPGPSSPRAAAFGGSWSRPTSPQPLDHSLLLQCLNEKLIKQQRISKRKAVHKRSAYFGHGSIHLVPSNQVPPNLELVNEGLPQRSSKKKPSNQNFAHQVSSNQEPLNQRSPTQVPSQPCEQEVDTTADVQNFTFGLSLDTICNHVQLDLIPGKGVFEYIVEFIPQEDNTFFKYEMIRQHEEVLGDDLFFSGENLFLSTASFEERYFVCIHPISNISVLMNIKFKGPASDTDSDEILNMVFSRIMTYLGLKKVGCGFLDPLASINLTHYGLEIWPGYVPTVRQCDGGLQVSFNPTTDVVHSKSVLELIYHLKREKPGRFQEECSNLIADATIITRYDYKIYKIESICWDKHPESSFTTNQENQVTYLDFYQSNYQIIVKDMDQPLLLAHAIRTTNIPKEDNMEEFCTSLFPELCYIIGLTKEMRINQKLVKNVTQRFQPSPTILHDGICKLLQKISDNDMSQRLLTSWGLNVGEFPIMVESRVLNQETVWFKNTRIDLAAGQARWPVDHQLLINKDLRNWVILHLEDDMNLAQELECNLQCVARSFDMRIYPGRLLQVPDNSTESYLQVLHRLSDSAIQLVVILLPSTLSGSYSAVKRFCCIEKPLVSQVILTQTLSKTLKVRRIKNLVMQINCKLGGALWSVTIPYKRLMVCGIYIFPDSVRKCLVMGFVASSDPLQLSWHSKVGFGASIEEFGVTLYLGMLGALKHYKECSLPIVVFFSCVNSICHLDMHGTFYDPRAQNLAFLTLLCTMKQKSGDGLGEYWAPILVASQTLACYQVSGVLPDRILVYRDELKDEQFGLVDEIDIPNFTKSFRDVAEKYQPKLTVIMCQRKVMTRLMVVEDAWGGMRNPIPGVVLDHTITRCDLYDFFLISQDDKYGIVTPTHYTVIFDSGDMSPDKLQKITYKMAHLYYNVPGLISIPAPVHYAQCLAQLVGEHLHEEPSPVLSDKLYFL